MRDVVLLAVVVGFFALTALYVRWADGLVGSDDSGATDGPDAGGADR